MPEPDSGPGPDTWDDTGLSNEEIAAEKARARQMRFADREIIDQGHERARQIINELSEERRLERLPRRAMPPLIRAAHDEHQWRTEVMNQLAALTDQLSLMGVLLERLDARLEPNASPPPNRYVEVPDGDLREQLEREGWQYGGEFSGEFKAPPSLFHRERRRASDAVPPLSQETVSRVLPDPPPAPPPAPPDDLEVERLSPADMADGTRTRAERPEPGSWAAMPDLSKAIVTDAVVSGAGEHDGIYPVHQDVDKEPF